MKINKKNNLRIAVLIVSIILLATMVIGGTVAYLVDESDSITNLFTPSKVTTEVVGTPGENGIVTDVKIANTDNTQAYIRASVVVNWKKTDGEGAGNICALTPVEGKDYTINWQGITDGSWIKGSDGYYYYTVPVNPNSTVTDVVNNNVTTVLFTDVEISDSASIPDGYSLSIDVLGSGIQSNPTSVAADKWGVTLDGTTVINKN